MKKMLFVFALPLMVVGIACSSSLAGNGNRPGGTACDCLFVEEVTGIVTDICDSGGMTLDGALTIYGLGPNWFWPVDKPEPGEEVTVVYYPCTSTDLNIAAEIQVGDATIELRDENCMPLWRQ